MSHLTDEDLFLEFKAGSNEAFAQLVERFRHLLLMEAYYILKDAELAKDVVQELFMALLIKRNQISVKEKIYIYLLQSTRYNSLRVIRNLKTAEERKIAYRYLQEEKEENRPFEKEEWDAEVKDAINAISAPACKRVFTLLYLEDRSYQDVAHELNITTQVVRNQASRALKIIRSKLKPGK